MAILSLAFAATLSAQFQMPDPKMMSGIPRPVDDLPSGSISVRLIRGQLSNNIASHLVELHFANGRVLKANTDDAGRAQFDKLPRGEAVKATADVDGEHLESQDFQVPGEGGIRLMLVATDKNAPAAKSPAPEAPAVKGTITLSDNSRIVLEPGDDFVSVYYILELFNNNTNPVNPDPPFAFDMPKGAQSTTILDGSSPIARNNGAHVSLAGPVPPGKTTMQIVAEMPTDTGSLDLTQTFPASLDRLTILVRKVGDTKLESPTIERQQDFPNNGETVIGAMGGAIAAGKPIELHLTDIPHHSTAPRYTALTLAGVVVLAGVWAGTRRQKDTTNEADRKRLVARREKLFGELVKLERERRAGRRDDRSERRREELVAQLEHVYGALDDPERAGAAASA
ncbi:MAG TPA: hypothetical protein VN628_16935 [Vicinamibacterales bacterium]|nr:hypothetical protein [Vicinamibacterales bacterium]